MQLLAYYTRAATLAANLATLEEILLPHDLVFAGGGPTGTHQNKGKMNWLKAARHA